MADSKPAEHDDDDGGAARAEEAHEVEQRGAARPAVVYEVIRREGEAELERSPSAIMWSGLAAGLSMGFSFVAQAVIAAQLPDARWALLVSSFGYAIGFLVVILGRQQLFTENTLTPILPLLQQPTRDRAWRIARLWIIVLAMNLVGALAFGWTIGHTDVFGVDVQTAMIAIADRALAGDFTTTLLRAVFAGWLIALMVWMLPSAETARPLIIILLTYVIALAGFVHVIAGATEVFFMATTGRVAWSHALGGWVVPAFLGNVLGGVTLVTALNHAQVKAGGDGQ